MVTKEKIIQNFQLIIEEEKAKDKTNTFRIRSYNKVITILKGSDNDFSKFKINDFETFFKKNGIKNPTKTIDKMKQVKKCLSDAGLNEDKYYSISIENPPQPDPWFD